MQPTHTPPIDSHRTRMSREARTERRRTIAGAVKRGMTVEEASRAYAVTIKTVQNCCRENGVPYGGMKNPPERANAKSKRSSRRVEPAAAIGVGSG